MKKLIVLLMTMITAGLIFWSCSDDDSSTEPSNDPPTCVITSPADNETFTIGDSILVDVDSNDSDGNIFEVRFYFDGVFVSTDDEFQYSCIISTKSYDPGIYTVKAIAFDTDGAKTSTEVNINLSDGSLFIQGGTFQMGDGSGLGFVVPEEPVHSVTLSDFYMGATEVTNKEYCDMLNFALGEGVVTASTDTVSNTIGESQELLNLDDPDCQITYNGSNFVVDTGLENYPVLEVTWYGSAFYCNMMSDQAGYTSAYNLTDWTCNWSTNGYRLPTEAEWEYAARGGTHNSDNYTYSGCNEIADLTNYAWYWDNSDATGNSNLLDGHGTLPVGTKLPNQLGIYDMSGNVLEWCWDWFDFYTSDAQTDPTGPTTGSRRVLRGGDWHDGEFYCRVACREYHYPSFCYDNVGFRLSRTP